MTTFIFIGIFIGIEILLFILIKHQKLTTVFLKFLIRFLMLSLIIFLYVLKIYTFQTAYLGLFFVFSMVFIKYLILWIKYMVSKKTVQNTYRMKRLIVMSLIWFFAWSPFLLFPNYQTIPQTGNHKVLIHTYEIKDDTSHDAFAHRSEERVVIITCWYPSIDDEKLPLVIYSHGGISTATSNESLYIELASHGFMVCAITHTYHSIIAHPSNGKSIWIDRQYFSELQKENVKKDMNQSFMLYQKWMSIRVHDISLVIDDLKNKAQNEQESDFHRGIDFDLIAVMGHSLGGSAALCMPDIRNDIKVVIALESPYMCDIKDVEGTTFIYRPIDILTPTLHIYSDSKWYDMDQWPQYQRNLEVIDLDLDHLKNIHIKGSGHFSLTDLGLMSPVLSRFLNQRKTLLSPEDTLKKVNEEVLIFLNEFLLSK